MKKVLLLAIWSSLLFGENMMGGWNSGEDSEEAKAHKVEQARLCTLYTDKIVKYKATMRDDGLAQATLNNYVRLQTKYCEEAK